MVPPKSHFCSGAIRDSKASVSSLAVLGRICLLVGTLYRNSNNLADLSEVVLFYPLLVLRSISIAPISSAALTERPIHGILVKPMIRYPTAQTIAVSVAYGICVST